MYELLLLFSLSLSLSLLLKEQYPAKKKAVRCEVGKRDLVAHEEGAEAKRLFNLEREQRLAS